jgi:hypothetical protein
MTTASRQGWQMGTEAITCHKTSANKSCIYGTHTNSGGASPSHNSNKNREKYGNISV